jgi:hypothetical protein
MQKQIRVDFVPRKSNCPSLKVFSYSIITTDKLLAEIMAKGLLEQDTEEFDRYRAETSLELAYNA